MNTQNYRYLDNCVEVNIRKPLYGTFVYIREEHITYAKKHGIPLKITIPHGTFTISHDDWMKNAKRIEKVFLRPDQPMVLWGNHVIKGEKPKPKQEEIVF